MKKFSQEELLEEGFWNVFKSPILRGAYGAFRGITKGGEYLLKTALPELTQPIDKIGDFAIGLKDAVKHGFDLGKGGKITMMKDMLEEYGWVLDETRKPVKKGPNTVVFARRAIDTDKDGNLVADMKSKPQPLLMDKYGNFNTSYMTRTSGKNVSSPR